MSTKYTHLELGKDVDVGIGGHYTPEKEERLQYNGREVLYVSGSAEIEASCCGGGSWKYAIVPGYIVSWQNTKNEAALPVSEVEPILDEKVQSSLRHIIKINENASLIDFW